MPRLFDFPILSRNQTAPGYLLAIGSSQLNFILAHNESTEHPVSVLTSAGEVPPSIEPPSVVRRFSFTVWPERACEDHVWSLLIDPVIADHRAPADCTINPG
jgi:hypothetical protein